MNPLPFGSGSCKNNVILVLKILTEFHLERVEYLTK